ncbi:Cell morphogenesis protein PAG1, partial [Ascosphaera pollenicola]
GFLNYSSGRAYKTADEAIDDAAADLFFALSTNNSAGTVAPAPEKGEIQYEDDSDDFEIICERPRPRPEQSVPTPRWYGGRRKSHNWSCRFDNKGQQETLKRKRDSDQESNASKRVRTNDGKSLTKGKFSEQDTDRSKKADPPYKKGDWRFFKERQGRRDEERAAARRHWIREIAGHERQQKERGETRRSRSPDGERQGNKPSVPGLTLLSPDPLARRQFSLTMDVDPKPGQEEKGKQTAPNQTSQPQDRIVHRATQKPMSPPEVYKIPLSSTFNFEVPKPVPVMMTSRPIVQTRVEKRRWNLADVSNMAFFDLMDQYSHVLRDCLTSTYRLEQLCRLHSQPAPVYRFYRANGSNNQVLLAYEYHSFHSGEAAMPLVRAGVFFMGESPLRAGNPWGMATSGVSTSFEEAKEMCATAVVWELMRMLQSGMMLDTRLGAGAR